MPIHVTITDLAKGYIKKAAKTELAKVKAKLVDVGQTAAAAFVCTQLQARTGLPREKCQGVADIVVRRLTKIIREKIKA